MGVASGNVAGAQGKQAKGALVNVPATPPKSRSRVVRTETDRNVLNDLVQRWKAFKMDVAQVRHPVTCQLVT